MNIHEPSGKNDISIGPPLEGEWKLLRPPGHHPYAVDFMQMDPDRKVLHSSNILQYIAGRIPTDKYYSWARPVFSPINGKIVRTGNGQKDNHYTNIWKTISLWYNATYRFKPELLNGRVDIRPNAGNHVMIQSDHGYVVFLAHLKNNSILVNEGDRVTRGQNIGLLGNSGNSTMPHLHINIFDQASDLLKSALLPFVFSDYEQLSPEGQWVRDEKSVPDVGSIIRFKK